MIGPLLARAQELLHQQLFLSYMNMGLSLVILVMNLLNLVMNFGSLQQLRDLRAHQAKLASYAPVVWQPEPDRHHVATRPQRAPRRPSGP